MKEVYFEGDQMQPSTNRFSPQVELALRTAGWFPERVVPMALLEKWIFINNKPNEKPYQVKMFYAAWQMLREFGGLIVQNKPDARCACGSIIFDPLQFYSDGWSENFWLIEWQGTPVYPFGQTYESILAINGQGQIFDAEGYLWGNTMEEALQNLIVDNVPQDKDWIGDEQKYGSACELLPWMQRHFG